MNRFSIVLVMVTMTASGALLAQRPTFPGTANPNQGGFQPAPVDTAKRGPKVIKRSSSGSALLDDSTRQIYGPTTTRWTTEKNIFNNQETYVPLDTSVINYHRWTYIQRYQNRYHDLGNVGTALNPIFPEFSSTIGATSGFTSYKLYYQDQEPVYYDTKSPFTRIRLIWGGQGRAMSHIEFSRNINPRWNFGFDYRPILVEKQIQGRGRGDRQTVSHYYDFYTRYRSKNDRYSLLFSFRRMRHRVVENGGVDIPDGAAETAYFDANARPFLPSTSPEISIATEEYQNGLHLFQTYKLAKPAQLYLTTDIGRQKNKFTNQNSSLTTNYFDSIADPSATISEFKFVTFQQEAGLKGQAGFLFYNVYYKFRQYNVTNTSFDSLSLTKLPYATRGIENYLGGRITLRVDSTKYLNAEAEYLLDGNYRLQGKLTTPWFEASALSQLTKPGLMQQGYRGAHDEWYNSFDNVFVNQLQGNLIYRKGDFMISPGLRYTIINQFIFFRFEDRPGQKVLPVQSSGNQQLLNYNLDMTVRFLRKLYLRPSVVYSAVLQNDDDALQIPTLFINTQLTFEHYLFKKAIQVQIGTDVHWRSTYNAMAYDPAIQSFYVQSQISSAAFPLVDLFFNGRFKGGRFFVKYHNLMQTALGRGYLPTPTYPGQRSVLDFGFDLILFD